jgi:YVTN family beta-propeller protein
MPDVSLLRTLRRGAGCCILVLLGSCGGGGDDSGPTPKQDARARILGLPAGTPIPADAAVKGMFGPLKSWPVIAVHGALLPDGRVASFGTKADGTQTGYFVYDVWDPADDSHQTLANATGVDIFCSSQLVLADAGALFIAGGDNWTGSGTTNTGNNGTTLLNAGTLGLSRGGNINRARWYSTSTMLLNGEVYIQGGSGGTDRPEVRATDGSFRLLGGANTSALHFMYPRNFVAPDGRVFGYDSAGRMYYVSTAGNGQITMAGQFSSAIATEDASAAMFAPGRILQFGGNSNQAAVIDIGGGAPVVTATGTMLRQRRLSVATILADGKVVATGGSRVWNAMTDVSYEAEIWNPATGQWTVGASMQKPRLYHGNALLLPDATVLVFGGGAPSPSGVPGNLNAEIYYPPYLFAGASPALRPAITAAPTVVDVGDTAWLEVDTARPVARVTFVKTGSATHGWNMEQRFVDLPFEAEGTRLAVQVPARAAHVPPGMWMMFVIDDAGVPSQARLMRVNVSASLDVAVRPVLESPGDQTTVAGAAVDLQLSASDPNGDPLRFSASGLPRGLAIDRASGRITGVPMETGTSTVALAASDGINSAGATITWTVTSPTNLSLDPLEAAPPSVTGSAATFQASASGQNVRYRWDFGDGSPPTDWSPSAVASHVYTRAGVFYVSVTVTDDSGAWATETFVHNAYLAPTASAPAASGNLLLESRAGASARLWVVNPDNDSVSVFDTATRARLAEVPVGAAPRSIARAPDGAFWVVNRNGASISVISPASLAVTRTITLPRASQPYGITFASGTHALVALEATGELARLDATTGAPAGVVGVGPTPRHVAVASDGRTAYVSRFVTRPLPGEATLNVQTTLGGQAVGGEVVVVDAVSMVATRTIVLAHSDRPDAENQGRGIPNYLGAVAISPDGSQAFVPSKMDNVRRGAARDGLALNFQNTVRAISSRIDLATAREDLAARIDHDNASLASAAAFDPLGVYLFVALETSREVAVLDAHSRQQIMRIDVGRAPQGLVVAPDRRTLYVMNFMDRSVGVFDLSPLVQRGIAAATPIAEMGTVASDKLGAVVLKGKQLFYDARDTRLARDRYMSCASCHQDGGHDGRVWDLTGFGEGLRNTISLRGRAGLGHGWLHWSNNFDEVQDFEGQIRNLAGGTGLMTDAQFAAGTRSQPLGDRKAGLSADLDALAAYVGSLNPFDPSPHRTAAGALGALATQGRGVFTALNCAACHGGSAFSKSAANNPEGIGSLGAASGRRLWNALTGIDVPTLRDVWATAPYLHDGSAPTLEAAVRAHNGVTVNDADLGRLVAYLREIGGEEPDAPVPASGGLLGRYFGNVELAGTPLMTRFEAVDFNWGTAAPGRGVGADRFSARWTGSVVVPTSGTYRFRTVSDDGVRLWVNGTQRISNWTNHGATNNTTTALSFAAGQRVSIQLEYYENAGKAVMQLQWLPPGASTYTAIPASRLSPN